MVEPVDAGSARHFTGNTVYHHVHRLNPSIPFYRLPEAMADIPELQHPARTNLSPREIMRCLRLKMWVLARREMVSYSGMTSFENRA